MYDAFSAEYDLFVNWPARLGYELPFIQKVIKSIELPDHTTRVLDAACGTGQHALELAKTGIYAVGADYSSGMIAQAIKNREKKGVAVDFAQAGFGQLSGVFRSHPEFPFDLLLCLGNSLPHLLSREELAVALQDFASCIRPGGQVLLQNRNFDAVMAKKERWMDPQSAVLENREWVFIRFYDYRSDGLIDFNIMELSRVPRQPWQQTIHTTRLRPLLKDELVSLLESSGFEEIRLFGDMTGSGFDPSSSGNLIITAQVKK